MDMGAGLDDVSPSRLDTIEEKKTRDGKHTIGLKREKDRDLDRKPYIITIDGKSFVRAPYADEADARRKMQRIADYEAGEIWEKIVGGWQA